LAGGVTSDVQSFVSEPFRYVTYENETVRLKNNQATERVFETSLATQADAQALLARLAAIYSVKRQVFEVTVYKTLYRYFLGDVVRLQYDRYGLNNGAAFLVVGVSDNAATGQTVLTLWG
jgi:cell shape-determining protein MreC